MTRLRASHLLHGLWLLTALIPSPALPEVSLPQSAALRNETSAFLFQGNDKGIKLTSFANLLTRAEYLHPSLKPEPEGKPREPLWRRWRSGTTPDPFATPAATAEQLAADASGLANPFTVFPVAPEARLFKAPEDFTITRWESGPRRLEVDLQGKGLLLKATLRVTMSAQASYWQLLLHNQSSRPLEATVAFPSFSRVRVTSNAEDHLLAPHAGGLVLRDLLATHYRAAFMGPLTMPFGLFQGADQGFFMVDMNRSDLEPTAGPVYERAVRVSSDASPGAGAPAPLVAPGMGPLVAMENRVWLPAGGDLTLGPVVIGTYQGSWMEGARRVNEVRGRLPRMHRSPEWFERQTSIGEHRGAPTSAGLGQKGPSNATLVLLGASDRERSDYLTFSASVGGASGLRSAIDAVHQANGHVLLYLDGALLARDAPFARTTEGEAAAMCDRDGKPLEPFAGYWRMCPATQAWRDWVADTAAKLVRSTGADGVFLDSACTLANEPCYDRTHKHPSPFVWNWGVRQLLQEVRRRLFQAKPDAVLVAAGAADIAREYVDAFVTYSHAWTSERQEVPLARAVYPNLSLFEGLPADATPENAERFAAWSFANGLGLYAPAATGGPALARKLERLQEYQAALPELRTGGLALASVDAGSQDLVGRVFVGDRTVVTLANLGDTPFLGTLRLPEVITRLADPLTGLVIPRDAQGSFPVAVAPRSTSAWLATLSGSPSQ